ncbi:MAG TPA: hypothetical protein VHP13_01965 [Gammaproteobacteria bacterium]|jgi:hypothetical protein|nr:hypothetical protein [Gammaproteobacteria bacterium]
MRIRHIRLIPVLLLAMLPCLPAQADPAPADYGNSVLYLGKIGVTGHEAILSALQEIKLALQQPLSNDPRLADVMVCRLTDDIGTHAKQLLICGTNKVLNENRTLLQASLSTFLGHANPPAGGDGAGGSSSACNSGACFEQGLGILNQSINNQSKRYIKQQVNGAALRALLAKVAYPESTVVPAAATMPVPAAATAHV